MPIILTAEEEILVRRKTVIERPAPDGPFATVF